MTTRYVTVQFWLVVCAAFLLRFIGLNQQGFLVDEILTMQISPKPLTPMLSDLQELESNKPPIYYFFMHQWLKAGQSETWARLPSAVFGALTCGMFFLIGRRLLDDGAGWLMAVYLMISPFHLGYSQEARMYVMFGFAAGVALLCLILYFQEKKNSYLICFGLLSVVVNYTFSYGFFFLGFCGLLLLAQWKKLGLARSIALFAMLIVSFALFVPWLFRMIHVANTPELAQFYKGPPWPGVIYTFFSLGYGFDLGPTTNDLQMMGARYFPAHPAQTLVIMAGFTALAAVVGRGLWAMRKDAFLLMLCLGGLFIFLLGPAAISFLKPSVTFNPRYAFLVLIPFSLIMAAGVSALWRGGLPSRSIVLLYGVLLLLALHNFYFNPDYRREDLRKTARYVEQLDIQPKVIVVCADFLAKVVSHYYHGPASIVEFRTQGATFDADSHRLSDQLNGIDRFVVVYARTDQGDREHLLIPWLQSRYHLIQQEKWPGTVAYIFSSK